MGQEINKCPKCGRDLSLKMDLSSGSTMAVSFCSYCLPFSLKTDSDLKDFDIFIKCLLIAYKGFCLNERMHEKINSPDYHKFKQTWDVILIATEIDYKLWLAKILDEEDAHDCLKGYPFEGEYKETVRKITNWRNDFIAHFNLATLRDYKKFAEENLLRSGSIRSLFNKIITIADQYNRGHIPELKARFSEIEKKTLNEADEWLKASFE